MRNNLVTCAHLKECKIINSNDLNNDGKHWEAYKKLEKCNIIW